MAKFYHAVLPPHSVWHGRLRALWQVQVLGRRKQLAERIRTVTPPLCLNLGSADSLYDGWIATDYPVFDITNPGHWQQLLGTRQARHLLAEHVLEHLTWGQVDQVLAAAWQYLEPGGTFRVAVPDANHPSPAYYDLCKPIHTTGSPTAEQHDHKNFWDYQSLSRMMRKQGFSTEFREWYDSDGHLHTAPLEPERGIIRRSVQRNYRTPALPDVPYSSLIIDAVKPRFER
jgi:predicted SAM-dependent methyltransferase